MYLFLLSFVTSTFQQHLFTRAEAMQLLTGFFLKICGNDSNQ